MYSDSADDGVVTSCLLDPHAIGDAQAMPSENTKPVVDFLSILSPAQSLSLNPLRSIATLLHKKSMLRIYLCRRSTLRDRRTLAGQPNTL